MERANRLAAEDGGLGTASVLFCSGSKGQDGIDPWVPGRDAFEMSSHDFNGRYLLFCDQMSEIGRVEIAKILWHAVGCHCASCPPEARLIA